MEGRVRADALDEDGGGLLEEDDVGVEVGLAEDAAHAALLALDEGLTDFPADLLPSPRRHGVEDVDEDGVEDGEAEELEGHADVLLGGGDGRVLAPADWLDEVDHILHGG